MNRRDFVSLTPGEVTVGDETFDLGDFAKPTFRSVLVGAGHDGGHSGAVAPQPHPADGRRR